MPPLLACLLSIFCLLFLIDAAVISDKGTVPLALPFKSSHLLARNATLQNSTALSEAREIVRNAQAAIAEINIARRANPLRNTNKFWTGQKPLEGNRVAPLAPHPTTDPAVVAAAALISEADAEPLPPSARLNGHEKRQSGGSFWMEGVEQNGFSPFSPNPGTYKVFRSVRDYGAKGDGVTDDTKAINLAISAQDRCGVECGTSSTLGAVIYFPGGTYLVSSSIIQFYYTQFIGNPHDRAVIKAAPSFVGLGVISSDVYTGVKNPDGSDGEWYINQSNFMRQIRNLVIDISSIPANMGPAGLHWQVGQATSLQNIEFIQNNSAGNNHVGIFMENGSGGFLSDLTFTGGSIGMQCGNQQFTSRHLSFNGCDNAVQMFWDWGWVWKDIQITGCRVGFNVTGGSGIGSILLLDSAMATTQAGIVVSSPSLPENTTQITLDNVNFAGSAPAVVDQNGATILAGSTVVSAWAHGKVYNSLDGSQGHWQTGPLSPRARKSASLLDGNGNVFGVSKPQYESVGAGSFINVKSLGAKGDGSSDDSQVLNQILSSHVGQIIYFPFGVYMVSDTVNVPVGSIIVGQAWSQIMAYGAKFEDEMSPHVMFKVGNEGDVGTMSIQDMMFTVRGPTAGAVLVEWNVKGSFQGAASMWDSHFRVGGARGSNLQTGNCPKSGTSGCKSAALLFHLGKTSSAYIENVWVWTADHDLDIPEQTQINVFSARCMLIEGPGPTWLYGTGSEHCILYQYQAVEASNIFMAQIQTETPYMQPAPAAPAPFTNSIGQFPHDPTFSDCSSSNRTTCAMAWAVRLVSCTDVAIYGAGLYNFFQNYDQTCIDVEKCQSRLFQTIDSGPVFVLNLVTKATQEMASPDIGTPVESVDNQMPDQFVAIVAAWMALADHEGGTGIVDNTPNISPTSATILPLPCTTVGPTATFTITPECAEDICNLPTNYGVQNKPPGPDDCARCDIVRRLTGTCCGIGGSIANPIYIPEGVELCTALWIPPQSIAPFDFDDTNGVKHDEGKKVDDDDEDDGDDDDDDDDIWIIPLFPFPVGWIFPPGPLPPPIPVGDLDCDINGDNCCKEDILPDIGLCANGNFPVFNPFEMSIDCDFEILEDALDARPACQQEADEDPESANEAIDSAEECNWDDGEDEDEDPDSCPISVRRSLELELELNGNAENMSEITPKETHGLEIAPPYAAPHHGLQKRVAPKSVWPCRVISGRVFPFASTVGGARICDATYFCPGDNSHYPNICANMASAINVRGKANMYDLPRKVPGSVAKHLTDPYYKTHARSEYATGDGGWSINGCEVDEFPFQSLKDPAKQPVLRQVEKAENGAAGLHWKYFRDAVIKEYSGTHEKRLKVNGAAGLIRVCFDPSGDTPGANRNWGLDDTGTRTNLCQQPYGVGFVLTQDDPWWDTTPEGRNSRLTWTKTKQVPAVTITANPEYCDYPAPGALTLSGRSVVTRDGAEPSWKQTRTRHDGALHTSLRDFDPSCAPFPYLFKHTTFQGAVNTRPFYKGNVYFPIGDANFPGHTSAKGGWTVFDDDIVPRRKRSFETAAPIPLPFQKRVSSESLLSNISDLDTTVLPGTKEKYTRTPHLPVEKQTAEQLRKPRAAEPFSNTTQNAKRQSLLGSILDIAFYEIFPSCGEDRSDQCVVEPLSCPAGPVNTGGDGGAYTGPENTDSSDPTDPVTDPDGPPGSSNPTIPGWVYQGCYVDENNRLLPARFMSSQDMSLEFCRDYCDSQGMDLFGVESSSECWCDNYIRSATGATKVDDTECNVPCVKTTTEYCGATWRIGIWQKTLPIAAQVDGYTHMGCYTDQDTRTLGERMFALTTVDQCASDCKGAGYSGFGLENGNECWCASKLSASASKTEDAECNKACGTSNVLCGGVWRINVYEGAGFGSTPTTGMSLVAVNECPFDDSGFPCPMNWYWQMRDYTVGDQVDACNIADGDGYGRYNHNYDNNGRLRELPNFPIVLSHPVQKSYTSCTWTATATAPDSTGTLICPQLPTPVLCPPTKRADADCVGVVSFNVDPLVECLF